MVVIYNLMPQRVKDLCVASYKEIAPRIEKSGTTGFNYQGVTIKSVKTAEGTDLQFLYGGHTIVMKNYARAEFDAVFGL